MQAPMEVSTRPPAVRPAIRTTPSQARFARWFGLVYFPLALLAVSFVLFVTGVLPQWGRLPLVLLAAWGLVAVRLLQERRRLGVQVPIPKSLVLGIAMTAGAGLFGALLIWGGINRLATTWGVVLLYLGVVLVITAVLAPLFRGIDFAIRAVATAVLGGRRRR